MKSLFKGVVNSYRENVHFGSLNCTVKRSLWISDDLKAPVCPDLPLFLGPSECGQCERLLTHRGDWLLHGTTRQQLHLQTALHLFLCCCYLSTSLEMCLLMSVCTREKPRQSESSEAHSCFGVCSGSAVCE